MIQFPQKIWIKTVKRTSRYFIDFRELLGGGKQYREVLNSPWSFPLKLE